ncbi:MAG: hypothetical protein ACI4HO_08485 [Ruminococcus sp.]
MLITFSKNKREVLEIIKKDIDSNKKYVKSGYTIGGDVTDNKVQLQLNDDYGKHSSFMSQVFYGTVIENRTGCEIKGSFRIKTMALVLLLVLFAFAVESTVASLVLKGFSTDLFMPLLVIAAEVLYFIYIKRSSSESNKLIKKYLNSIDND